MERLLSGEPPNDYMEIFLSTIVLMVFFDEGARQAEKANQMLAAVEQDIGT